MHTDAYRSKIRNVDTTSIERRSEVNSVDSVSNTSHANGTVMFLCPLSTLFTGVTGGLSM